jgi:DNA topoisomerase 2-associated protein PAT1
VSLLLPSLTGDTIRLEFDDTYDGLGDKLEEAGDDFNDDTFGGGLEPGTTSHGQITKEFDFFGQTAQVSNVIEEEHLRYNLQQKHKTSTPNAQIPASKPKKTGYEKYQDPGYIPEIQAKSSVWGTKPQTHYQEVQPEPISTARTGALPAKRMMSLAEVEAAMRAQNQPTPPPPLPQMPELQQPASSYQHPPPPHQYMNPVPQQHPVSVQQQPQVIQPSQHHQRMPSKQEPEKATQRPFQILQNPNRAQHSPQPSQDRGPVQDAFPSRLSQPTPSVPVITHPQQLMQLSEEQRKIYLEEDAKRAKRNHKIFMLSRGNGLMTPQDKNFITRIQLQQLVTATGNSGDADPEAALAEDFYYQVYSQIRGAPRQHPTQPLGHFAQTYLLQTGGRLNNRRQAVNGDNHMQRMQQQVQRAVEAAKLKPKNKQLIIEGSLGKISFSNAKTPKPLLNIKRPESGDPRATGSKKGTAEVRSSDRKSALRSLEIVYQDLMQMEDHERQMPPPPAEGDMEGAQVHMEWRQKIQVLNKKLWQDLKVLEPIVPGSTVPHPFIAFLSFAKGQKCIPRIFRHIDQEQRVTILTMIVVHLDQLDVVARAQVAPGETQPSPIVREEIELFSQVVMPCLLGYVSEAPINIIIGLLGLVVDHTAVLVVAKTKIGLGILTMLLSRAELVKESGTVSDQDWLQWTMLYVRLFDTLEPILGALFPGPVNTGDDMYIWQFLAAVGIGASPEQQQRLVLGVK